MRCLSAVVLLVFLSVCPVGAEESEVYLRAGDFRLLGSGSGYLNLAAGEFDFGNTHTAAAGVLDLRFGRKLGFVGPALGLMASEDGGGMVFAGLYADLLFGKHLTLTPLWAAGLYAKGDGRDLGGDFEIRSAVTFAWRFDNGLRFGMNLAHVSNGGIYAKNPGENELMVSVSFPLGRFRELPDSGIR